MTERFRLPAEWEPQAAIIVAWPHAGTDWAPRLPRIETAYVALIAAIARFEPVLICVSDPAVRERATRLLAAAGIADHHLRFVEVAYDDTWLRDSGPLTLVDDASFRLVDFRFTGWGGKFEGGRDDRLIEALVERRLFGTAERRRIEWALEGGAVESDGKGTLLTTWRCLHQRHPNMSREEMSAMLTQSLAAERVLWLDRGFLQGDDTDAHIDTLARFAPDDAVVFQTCDDPTDPHYEELARMRDEIANLRTTDGRAYRLHPLPWPRAIIDDGRRLASSYANYLIVNDAVVMPSYGDSADQQATEVLSAAHPGREIVAVDARALIWQNGSVHCLTMQLPQGVLAG